MLSQIHPFLIEKHKQQRVQAGHVVAVNRELAALSTMFNRLTDWGRFDGANPVKKIKRIREPLTRLRFLTAEEEPKILAELSEPQKTVVLLGLYMGLRINAEALTLTKENVDLENRLLTIEAAYSKSGQTQTITIHSALIEPLRARINQSKSEYRSQDQQGSRDGTFEKLGRGPVDVRVSVGG